MAKRTDETVLTIKLRKGLADRQRLPLAHVLSVLDEFRQIMAEVGKKLQRDRGVSAPTGDFGLEIIAGKDGLAFHGGSVVTPLAITNNVQTGVLAAQEIVRILGTLEKDEGVPDPSQQFDRAVLRRIARVAAIQRRDKLELEVAVYRPGDPEPLSAVFGSGGLASIRALQAPAFEVEGITLYGKLVELVDRDQADEGGRGFWGELRRENGEAWRVQFRASDLGAVTCLFRRQVAITGKAVYYRVANPKIVAETVLPDRERDYEAAFDELYGCYKDVIKTDLTTLLRKIREED